MTRTVQYRRWAAEDIEHLSLQGDHTDTAIQGNPEPSQWLKIRAFFSLDHSYKLMLPKSCSKYIMLNQIPNIDDCIFEQSSPQHKFLLTVQNRYLANFASASSCSVYLLITFLPGVVSGYNSSYQ